MNRRFSLEQLQSLRKPESLLVLILLVVVVAWYYLDGKASDADAELLSVETTLAAAQDDLRYWTNNFDQLTLQDELAVIISAPKPPTLPTQSEALGFRTSLMTYASQQQLPLSSLEVLDITRELGDSQYPAVRYVIVISGELNALVGSMRIFESFSTASVQSMDFFRADQGPNIWGLSITLDVIHQPEET
ncbi:MAG: hypothetical protein HQ475_04680 [SAR202 cluster bacterium]|nr:hypothetical protein [SAR202 cluster bacterium]